MHSIKFILLATALIPLVGCTNQSEKSEMTEAQDKAYLKCESLQGIPRLEESMLYGEVQIFCKFSDGECTQGELNRNECYKDK